MYVSYLLFHYSNYECNLNCDCWDATQSVNDNVTLDEICCDVVSDTTQLDKHMTKDATPRSIISAYKTRLDQTSEESQQKKNWTWIKISVVLSYGLFTSQRPSK